MQVFQKHMWWSCIMYTSMVFGVLFWFFFKETILKATKLRSPIKLTPMQQSSG